MAGGRVAMASERAAARQLPSVVGAAPSPRIVFRRPALRGSRRGRRSYRASCSAAHPPASLQTARSLPLGSAKWKRRPHGKASHRLVWHGMQDCTTRVRSAGRPLHRQRRAEWSPDRERNWYLTRYRRPAIMLREDARSGFGARAATPGPYPGPMSQATVTGLGRPPSGLASRLPALTRPPRGHRKPLRKEGKWRTKRTVCSRPPG